MQKTAIVDAIVYTSRDEIHQAVAHVLKVREVSNITRAAATADAKEALSRFPKGLLIVDWDSGDADAVQVLAHNFRDDSGRFRPVLVLVAQLTPGVVATMAEYGVQHVFTEKLSKDSGSRALAGRIGQLLVVESQPNDVTKGIISAQEKLRAGDQKGAIQILTAKLQQFPGNVRLMCDAAAILMEQEQWHAALKLLTGIEKADPPCLRGIHLVGRCLLKLGRTNEALTMLAIADAFNPNDVERLVDVGLALFHKGETAGAAERLRRANELDPDHAGAKVGLGHIELMEGNVNHALNLLKDTTTTVEKAAIFNLCAIMSIRRGETDRGMDLYKSALGALGEDGPLAARLHFNMGIAQRRAADPKAALKSFERAANLDPSFAKARGQVALLHSGAPKLKAPPAPFGMPPPLADDPIALFDDEDFSEEHLSTTVIGQKDDQSA